MVNTNHNDGIQFSSPVKFRTRFAPSPTGDLHIGGARTALFCWLFARQNKGDFILRIEDTDQLRSTQESVNSILESMEWLGLDYDEGPYYQTDRLQRYREVAEQLLAEGKAYRCFCSVERLERLREDLQKQGLKPRYDGHCRNLINIPNNQSSVIRLLNPQDGYTSFSDQIRGKITVANEELDDLILVRSDGMPTYHFTVVVDDMDMEITHVIRGDDHIANTPRQINILHALQAHIPVYAHIPMILNEEGKRLSKRDGATNVMSYREQGILPQALLNYLVRLGWSNKNQEIFSREEMISLFNLSAVQKSPAALNKQKLQWLNHYYIKNLPLDKLMPECKYHYQKLIHPSNNYNIYMHDNKNISEISHDFKVSEEESNNHIVNVENNDSDIKLTKKPYLEVEFPEKIDIAQIIELQRSRNKNVLDLVASSLFFFHAPDHYPPDIYSKVVTTQVFSAIQCLWGELDNLVLWQADNIGQLIKLQAEKAELSLGDLAQAIRLALTGTTVSPPLDRTIYLLGKEEVLKRLKKILIN